MQSTSRIARGEIPQGNETAMLVEAGGGAADRAPPARAPLDEQFIEVLVNTVVAGAAAGAARINAPQAD